jgi:hypothetical protein
LQDSYEGIPDIGDDGKSGKLESGIQLVPDELKEASLPDYLLEKPVPVDLLVDTHCRPLHCRIERAKEILHTLSTVLYYSGQMKAHEIAGVHNELARKWERIDRDNEPVQGEVL